MTNRLYYGDNLEVLRAQIGNSNAGYNVLFKSASGAGTDARGAEAQAAAADFARKKASRVETRASHLKGAQGALL